MVFGWFRKKRATRSVESNADAILALPDDKFGGLVAEIIANEIPPTHAMIVEAYENLTPMIGAFMQFARENNDSFSIDSLVELTASSLHTYKDDINSRRMFWFFLAALVRRLTEKAASNTDLRPIAADVWVALARSGKHLRSILEYNVVWKDNEKVLYSQLQN